VLDRGAIGARISCKSMWSVSTITFAYARVTAARPDAEIVSAVS
jgi:hypothetical protein